MLKLITSVFSLDQINAELAQQGMPAAEDIEIAATVLVDHVRKPGNLNGWTALYLDVARGVYVKDDLQAILVKAGATSPSAASHRVCMQRYPDKHNVKAHEQARPENVPASGRRGSVKAVALDLAEDKTDALATYIQAAEAARLAKAAKVTAAAVGAKGAKK